MSSTHVRYPAYRSLKPDIASGPKSAPKQTLRARITGHLVRQVYGHTRSESTKAVILNRSNVIAAGSDHRELDLAAFNGSRRKGIASHPFDDRPIREKVLLRLCLRW